MVSSKTVFAYALLMACLGASVAPAQELDTSGLPPETLGQSTPIFGFLGEASHPGLVFVHSGSATDHEPRVFASSRDGWRLVQLPDGFHNLNWAYTGRNVRNYEIWAVLQAGGEAGPGLNLLFASGSSDGRSWRYRGSLQKISRYAVVEMLGMNDGGKGTIVLRLDDDPTPESPRLGYYSYMTKDGGRSWGQPLYSSSRPSSPTDMLAPAEKSYDPKLAPDVAAWRQLLGSMQPPG